MSRPRPEWLRTISEREAFITILKARYVDLPTWRHPQWRALSASHRTRRFTELYGGTNPDRDSVPHVWAGDFP